jgi:hypothetical protein
MDLRFGFFTGCGTQDQVENLLTNFLDRPVAIEDATTIDVNIVLLPAI